MATMPSMSKRGRRWSHRSLLIMGGLVVQLYSVQRFLRLLVVMVNHGDRHGDHVDLDDEDRFINRESEGSSTLLGISASNYTTNSALHLQMLPNSDELGRGKNQTGVHHIQKSGFPAAAAAARNVFDDGSNGTAEERTSFVSFYNDTDDDDDTGKQRRCRLREEFGLRHVGCGMDGHVYEAHLECDDGDGDGDPSPRASGGDDVGDGDDDGDGEGGSRRRGRRIVRVAIKVFTRKAAPKAPGAGPRVYANASDDGRGRELYRRLMMPGGANSTTTKADEVRAARLEGHFALALGTVTFPLKMLHGRRGRCVNYKMVDETTAAEPPRAWIRGNVLPLLSGGRPLSEVVGRPDPRHPHPRTRRGRGRELDPATRRGIARDLVRIHRHMFRRGVVHCDLSLWHFYHSPSADRTTLIDFERCKSDDAPDPGSNETSGRRFLVLFAGQLWQLLSNIAQVCDPGGVAPFDVPSNVCGGHWDRPLPEDVIPDLIPAFESCRFDRKIAWREGDMWNDTAEAYEALAVWSGLFD